MFAARAAYNFGLDPVMVLEETDQLRRRVRMAALEVWAIDHTPRSRREE